MADTTQILTAAIATNSPPTLSSDGFGRLAKKATLLVASTAGSGTMTVTIRLWGYNLTTAVWHPLGPGTAAAPDAARGVINAGNAIGEVAADKIQHAEIVDNLNAFAKIYAEISAIGGTSTAVSAWLVWDN